MFMRPLNHPRVLQHLPLLFLLQACAQQPGLTTTSPLSRDSAVATMRRGLAAALQARGDDAVAILRPIHSSDLDERARGVRACMLARLGDRKLPPAAVRDPFVRGVLAVYREYWIRSLRAEAPLGALEGWLRDSLNSQLRAHGSSPASDLDSVETALGPMIEADGYHSLMGVTSPLRDLMLWRTERTEQFAVPLPQGVQPVTVVFLDDFASLGWVGFATCDRYHSGGWTKPDR